MSKPIKIYKGKPHANKLCRSQAYAWVALHVEDAFATVVDEADGAVETNFSRYMLQLMPQIISLQS